MMTATDFAKQLSRFLSEYLPHERNVSPNTLSAYRDAFVQYIDYMHTQKGIAVERLCLKDLTRQNVLGYLNWILDERHCSPATRNYRLAAIHAFVSYLQYNIIEQSEEWQKILSIKAMRTEKKALNYLSPEGIRLLLQQPDVTTRQGRRHLAMLPMVKEQVGHLKQYMEENRLDSSNMFGTPLFFNNRHEKLTREGVAYVLKTYADMARKVNPSLIPDRLSCHSIRHSKAMHLLQSGVNLVYIRDILGHVSIQTTDIYARADSKAKREALEKAYVDLNPEVKSDRAWERDKNLREWLKGLNH